MASHDTEKVMVMKLFWHV